MIEAERRVGLTLPVAALLAFVASAVYFASLQSIWVDETTQLSGVTLPLVDMLTWLAGRPVPEFGVPGDRMPPVSYLIDWTCARTLCSDEVHFRWLHIAIAAGGVALLTRLAFERFGWRSALVTVVLLALSPKLVDTGVEIRAYPIFFAITCVQLWLFCRLAASERLEAGKVVAFGALGVLAVYTHFFGLVSTMAFLVGLAAGRLTERRDFLLLAGCGASVLLCAMGLAPIILSAQAMSGTESYVITLAEIARFGLKLAAHPAQLLSGPASLLFFAGLGAMLATTLWRLMTAFWRSPRTALRDPLAALFIALIAGIAATLMAAFLVKGFEALKTSYSIWMFPLIVVLAAAAVAPSPAVAPRRLARPLQVAVFLLAVGAVWTHTLFLQHARWFTHGPGEAIARQLQSTPTPTAVVYRGEWAWGYFPVFFWHHDTYPQWLMREDGKLYRLRRGGLIDDTGLTPAQALGGRHIILADTQLERYDSLRLLFNGVPSSSIEMQVGPPPALAGWRTMSIAVEPGFYWTRLTTFKPEER